MVDIDDAEIRSLGERRDLPKHQGHERHGGGH